MVAFELDVSGFSREIAIVAAHGVSDIDSLLCVPIYAVLLLVPLPSLMVTVLFCIASVFHFYDDVGACGSVALHVAAFSVTRARGKDYGFKFMSAYLFYVHTPLHVMRLVQKSRALGCAASLSACFIAYLHPCPPCKLSLSDTLQKIVIAHILVEALCV